MAAQTVGAGASLRFPLSYRDFCDLGETKHHDYYDGLVIVNPPSRRHVTVQLRLLRVLQDCAPPDLDVLSEWGWQVAPDAVVEPDIMVFPADADGDDVLRQAPLLVVEVSSPSTRGEDRGRKRQLYADGGAQWYWLVDLDASTLTPLRRSPDGAFAEVATYRQADVAELNEPFLMRLDLSALFAR